MSQNLSATLRTFQSHIAKARSGISADLTEFPSGSATLDVRRGGRAFVLAYSPRDGFAVDELQVDEGFDSGYRHLFDRFEPASEQLLRLLDGAGEATVPVESLNLVVIQARDPDSTRDFYLSLGLSFVAEQHGSGPRHYAATLGTTVFEIYPCSEERVGSVLRIGFQVPDVDQVVDSLRERGVRVVSAPKDSSWGRRAVVEDPDGNRVELTQSLAA